MPLMYKLTTQYQEDAEVELKVPTGWGMFSKAGNRSITNKATTLVKKVENETDFIKKLQAIQKFIKGWETMKSKPTTEEASDTDVREMVMHFAHEVGKCIGVTEEVINQIYQNI